MSHKLYLVILVALVHTVDTDGITLRTLTGQTAVEVVHGVAVVPGDGVETLAHLYRLLQCPSVVIDLVACMVGEMKVNPYTRSRVGLSIYTMFMLRST